MLAAGETRSLPDEAHILLVEDDDGMRVLVGRILRESGFRVTGCRGGAEMWSLLPDTPVDLVLLDVMLPGASGFDLLRALRAKGTVPVIMLSARNEEADRVLGLELGADDYVAKPFSPRELAARVKGLLRRASPAQAPVAATPHAGPFHDDTVGQRMHFNGQPLALTRREYRLLSTLLAGAGRIHSRDSLLAAAWGDDSDSTDRTIDTHIKTLRAKLRAIDAGCDYITTHRGMGYCLDLPAAARG